MASKVGPRSVKDATRFTSTIPHAASKAATAAAVPKATPAQNAAAAAKQSSRVPGETPEQRVQRLRMAHLAAQRAQISQTDKIIDASRRFFDVAHKWTVGGLVLFTGKGVQPAASHMSEPVAKLHVFYSCRCHCQYILCMGYAAL